MIAEVGISTVSAAFMVRSHVVFRPVRAGAPRQLLVWSVKSLPEPLVLDPKSC